MKITQQTLLFPVALLAMGIATFQACKSDSTPAAPAPDADKVLFNEISASTGFTYYDGGNLLSGVPPSPHGSFKLRFNGTAASALDGTGELPSSSTFPTGSIIVKEVYSGGSLSLYAVMKKDPSNANAGSGWVWNELKLDGSVVYSATLKGAGCVPCHSTAPNRDLSKTFDLH